MLIPDQSTNLNPHQEEKDSAEITQLNEKIADYQKQISEWLYELGLSYYKKHVCDEDAEEKERILKILHHFEKIELLQKRISEIRTPKKPQCSKCGADIMPGTVFCHQCGEKLVVQSAEFEETATPMCPYCYSIVKPEDNFCYVCGARISD